MAMQRERAVTILNRLGTGASDASTAMNVLMDFLITEGNADVAEAFMNRMDACNKVTITTLDTTLVSQSRNRNYSGRSSHNRD
jgi:hypothetical protein